MPFTVLNLNNHILKALSSEGYAAPTPVQAAVIPEILAGRDIMASAQTGTGKTAAFMLPALEKLSVPSALPGKGPRVLVLTPTRELAIQVTNAAMRYGKFLPRFKAVSIVGGMPYQVQNRLLSSPMDVLVATPGRLIDQIQSGRINFSRIEMLILDEADRMLDMGFIEDVELIAGKLPPNRQTLLFSATLEGPIAKLAKNLLKDPKQIHLAAPQTKHTQITQHLIYVDNLEHKMALLNHLISDIDVKQAIIFTATKRDADGLARYLSVQGQRTAALHGDMVQGARNRTIEKFRRNHVRLLVATDVAARGIDVSTITHVINFDLPKFADDYVHRIGRTGRAGQSGTAISFAHEKDWLLLKRIERTAGQPLEVVNVPGLVARFNPKTMAPKRVHKPAGKAPAHARGRRPGSSNNGDARRARPAGREGGNWRQANR